MIMEKMRKLTTEQTQKMIFYGLVVFLFILPIPQFFGPDNVKAIGVQTTMLNLFLLFFCVVLVIEAANKRIIFKGFKKLGLAEKCVLGLILVGSFSVIISKDKMIALYGTELQGEGLISLLAYYMLFYITTILENKLYRQKLLHLFLLLGSIVSIIGVMQFTGIYEFSDMFPGMACVPMRNPNFYGGFSVLFTGAAMGGFYLYRNESEVTHPYSKWNRLVWYIFILFGYAACICSDSSLVYAGLIMQLLLYLFLKLVTKSKDFVSFFSLVAGLLVLILVFDTIRDGKVMAQIMSVSHQVEEGGSIFADGVGSGRMLAWKNIITLLPEYGLFGCGIEQLGPLYIERFHTLGGYFDKAHNEYLNLWITEGVFAVVLYLMFLFALFFPGITRFWEKGEVTTSGSVAKDEVAMIALFAFFGYIAQAFFSISVVQVAPYFWIVCGLLYSRKRS
ncbi:MAG: O-antigen ligase family protein [Lachnospiraceae bacterium]|nr:O-antigen ligase family protein [Lachnospiraceae bacterium]